METTSVVRLVVSPVRCAYHSGVMIRWERPSMPSRTQRVAESCWLIRRWSSASYSFTAFTFSAPMRTLRWLATPSAIWSWDRLPTRCTTRWSKSLLVRRSGFSPLCVHGLLKEKWLYRGSNSGSLACQASVLATALYSLVSVFRFTLLIHLTGHCLTEDRNNSVEDS